MKMRRNLIIASATIVCCIVVVWFSTSIQGSQKNYEVKPHITIPEYKTDAARAIDAYERLMDRYMNLTEKNIFRIDTDIQEVAKKLDSIDNKLTKLSTRISGIEKALGIKQTDTDIKNDTTNEPQTAPADNKNSYSSEG
jgi:peptidoglycan hydrolase CwlO-like protein